MSTTTFRPGTRVVGLAASIRGLVGTVIETRRSLVVVVWDSVNGRPMTATVRSYQIEAA